MEALGGDALAAPHEGDVLHQLLALELLRQGRHEALHEDKQPRLLGEVGQVRGTGALQGGDALFHVAYVVEPELGIAVHLIVHTRRRQALLPVEHKVLGVVLEVFHARAYGSVIVEPEVAELFHAHIGFFSDKAAAVYHE